MMKLLDDDAVGESGFKGVVLSNKINKIEDAEKPKSPETFVGREQKKIPRVPKTLPASADPKKYETELSRTKHTYEKVFKDMNVVSFENWGFNIQKKKVLKGWELKKLE